MNKEKIEGMIFDMDGTLLDSMNVWTHAGEWYLQEKGKEAEKNLYLVLFSMSMEEGAVYLQKNYQLEESVEEIVEGINQIIWDFYEKKAVLKPGIQETLEDLKKQGIPLTIATATDYPIVEMVLKRLGIFEYFDKIFTCSEIGVGKHHPDIFLAALQYMGTSMERTWVVEDALYALKTAKAAGFPTMGVYDKYSEFEWDEVKKNSDIYIESWENETLRYHFWINQFQKDYKLAMKRHLDLNLSDCINSEEDKQAYEDYQDRLSMSPSPRKLTEEEIEELKKQGRI